jgi:hypothetical protein
MQYIIITVIIIVAKMTETIIIASCVELSFSYDFSSSIIYILFSLQILAPTQTLSKQHVLQDS